MTTKDISEDFVYDLSVATANPSSYSLNAESYDIAINDKPFFIASTPDTPYRRESAQSKREQIDQTTEPGEQSFTGWWFRSQSSFHLGAGARFFEPVQDENLRYRFWDSEGVNVWDKGKLTLLKDVDAAHQTTGTTQKLRSIKYSDVDAVLMLDGHDVDKITSGGSVIHFIDYNAGSDDPVYAICDDGTTAYWATNDINAGTNKAHLYKKALTGDSTTADTLMFNVNSYQFTDGKVVMEWVKGRIILCADNKVYELTPSSSSLPTPIFTHLNTSYTFTSVTESGAAIYVAGYAGAQSAIYKFTLSNAGAITSLTSAVVAAEMPIGEIIHSIKYYLGYMIIGTSKGIRVATVSVDDGSIAYGPLIAETDQPVYDITFRDRFVWFTSKVNGDAGLTRIDLGAPIEPLRFAYAHDVFKPDVTNTTTSCAFIGTTDRIAFSVASNYIYTENATRLVSSGYLRTGFIRYATLESKYFKFLKVRGDLDDGTINVSSIDSKDVTTFLYNVTANVLNQDLGIARPVGGQEFIALKFELLRNDTDNTIGAIMNGYQTKALPAIEKQRLIQFPLYCYDVEMDKYNNIVGSEDDRAYDRIQELEDIEKSGNTVIVQDFRTDETFSALIEEVRFNSTTPPSERFNGFGGLLLVTVRKL